MNVQNDKTTLADNVSVFGRAYEINAHTLAVVNAAIASGTVTADKVPDMIREVHKAFAESYAFSGVEALEASTAISVVAPAPEAVLEDVSSQEAAVEDMDHQVEPELEVEEPVSYTSIYADPYDAVTHEQIHCLIDGVGKKMLKRYIRAHYNLEWEDYLRIFDLPADYPSVAPKYSNSKSVEAKTLGLGSTVPKTPKALRALEQPTPATARSTSERRRRQRDPEKSGRIVATQAKVA